MYQRHGGENPEKHEILVLATGTCFIHGPPLLTCMKQVPVVLALAPGITYILLHCEVYAIPQKR